MLISIPEAAKRLGGVPVKPLADAALAHKLMVRIGSSNYVKEDELLELIEKCRCQPKERDSSDGPAKGENQCGSSKTPEESSKAHAQQIAAKLKSRSQNTSRGKTAKVVQLGRRK